MFGSNTTSLINLSIRLKIILFVFAMCFIVMIYGVSFQEWQFLKMTVVFFVGAILIGIIGKINEYTIRPEALGLSTTNLSGLSVNSAEESLHLIRDALGKQEGEHAQKAADIIALNAGAAVYVSGIANTLEEGVRMAEDAIGSGLAKAKIQDLAAFSDCCKIS